MAAIVSNCKCEHPRLVYNKYTGKEVYTSCHKCIPCQRARQSAWNAKMQREHGCHLYEFSILLEYNEQSLPKYDFSDDGESIVEITPRLSRYYTKYSHLKRIALNELQFNSDSDRHYFVNRLNSHHTCLPHASVYDVQLFKKRLNTYIRREITGKYQNFRSVFVSELGPDTFRPHYHGVLWFDDARIAEKLEVLVSRAWSDKFHCSLGYTSTSPSRGKITSYIAKYIVKPSHLPSFYEHPALRNFLLSSRRPPIGMLLESEKKIRKIFDRAAPSKIEFEKRGDLYVPKSVSIGQNIENRLFPKCLSFGQISDFDRVKLYKIAIQNDDVLPYKLWSSRLIRRCVEGDFKYLNHRFPDVPFIDRVIYGLRSNYLWFKKDYLSILIMYVTRNLDKERSLHYLYSVSSRVFHQAKVFDVSVDKYIEQILKFQSYNKPQFVLKNFYRMQNEVLKRYPDYDIRYFYPLTYMNEGFDPSCAPDSVVYLSDQRMKYEESLKNRKASQYREKKLKYNDYSLYSLIENYYAEKCNENVEAFAHTG